MCYTATRIQIAAKPLMMALIHWRRKLAIMIFLRLSVRAQEPEFKPKHRHLPCNSWQTAYKSGTSLFFICKIGRKMLSTSYCLYEN